MSGGPPWLAGAPRAEPGRAGPRGPSPQVRGLVLARAQGRCESCGEDLGGGWELHHRRRVGAGGSALPSTHQPPNLLALCGSRSGRRGCHDLVHHEVAAAQDGGLLVRSAADPARVPVLLWDGRRVLLLPGGTYGEEVEG